MAFLVLDSGADRKIVVNTDHIMLAEPVTNDGVVLHMSDGRMEHTSYMGGHPALPDVVGSWHTVPTRHHVPTDLPGKRGAMRATQNATISFGLVIVPVKVYKAADDKTPSFRRIHNGCGGQVGNKMYCKGCGEVVEAGNVARGVEYLPGEVVTLTDDELDRGIAGNGTIQVLHFVAAGEIDPIFFSDSHYVGPGDGPSSGKNRRPPPEATLRAFRLLLEEMETAGLGAICRVVYRERERLGLMRVLDGILVMHSLHWPDEIRAAELAWLDRLPGAEPGPEDRRLAHKLITRLVRPFVPDEHSDAYRAKVEAVIEAKVEGREIPEPANAGATVSDLTAALRASIEEKVEEEDRAAV